MPLVAATARSILSCIPKKLFITTDRRHISYSTQPPGILNPFTLNSDFVSQYATVPPPFGFNGLGEVVYRRTYSRPKPNNVSEKWFETVARVVTGTFRRQQEWRHQSHLPWDNLRAQRDAQLMYERIFQMKFLPPGRGLWAMGSAVTEERRLYAALNNCAFVSTRQMWEDPRPSRPFAFLMDAAMLGVGVGFDTRGAQAAAADHRVAQSVLGRRRREFVIPDSREGWVESVARLIDSYLDPAANCQWDFNYKLVRPAGRPIRGFGGISSGPAPLQELHTSIRDILDCSAGRPLSVTAIVDLMNLIGRCVVSGNVRRTAEIAFGDPDDAEFVALKDYAANPRRAAFGWTSNNSVFAQIGMSYDAVCQRVRENGEPGFQWMENARAFGRLDDGHSGRDALVEGANPCGEQSLESYEVCCLVETFPHRHATLEDFLVTLESAVLYAKTVTLLPTHWPETNRVLLRNRRIGTSVSGIAQFISARGVGELHRWLNIAYAHVRNIDRRLSRAMGVPESVKITSVKPSGSVSLLAGATPGMHYPESRFCIRRVRLALTSALLPALERAGYRVQPDSVDLSAAVVEFPVDHGEGMRGLSEVSMWEQLALAALLQRCWSDNQVSCTVTFDPETEGPQMARALEYYQYQLKSVSFLPRVPGGAPFPQMPYEAMDEVTYRQMVSRIKSVEESGLRLGDMIGPAEGEPEPERYCSTDTCLVLK
ncbi:hypothetical protein LPJ66_004142 [Kickxella alabastrina]|uniref:Uncharacterized protein n=1 Tax=Kickxella alabastrina TaxID=61397 RepID=A0ACC1ILY8_9FUNG|nr:hypothetical protein LPJ66_004142 [Kickxella alabastrina]